jgi:tRNA threonylcarbamoyladenosine biosynthesis protein TsaE
MSPNHNQPPAQLTRFLATAADTVALGAALAPGLRPGMVIFLRGDLGAGKTTLVRGIFRGLGVTERIKSPTFTIVEPYIVSSLYFYHFDFYRFDRPDEWIDAGLRECFNEHSVCIVEWPEKAGGQLPAADFAVTMKVDGDGRSVMLSAETEAGRDCLTRLQH